MKLKAQPFYFLKTTGEIVFFFLLKCESVRIMILMDDTMIEIMARLHLTDVSTRLIFFFNGRQCWSQKYSFWRAVHAEVLAGTCLQCTIFSSWDMFAMHHVL